MPTLSLSRKAAALSLERQRLAEVIAERDAAQRALETARDTADRAVWAADVEAEAAHTGIREAQEASVTRMLA